MDAQAWSMSEVFLTEAELASRWGLAASTLTNRRWRRQGPPFVKLNGRTVRYRLSDVLAIEASGERRTALD
jgi:predicted DNA-binding transcriptional regulator AlpA